jgi:DNA-binding transcriptional ArsR family regulator
LRILIERGRGPTPVGEIAQSTGLSPSLVSHHLRLRLRLRLRLLRATRIVRVERKGRRALYSLDDQHIDRVLTDMVDHLGKPAQITEGTP